MRKLGELLKKREKVGSKYVPPSTAVEHEAVPVTDEPHEDEENELPPVIEKKRYVRGKLDSKRWIWVLIAALSVAAVIGLVVVVVVLGR